MHRQKCIYWSFFTQFDVSVCRQRDYDAYLCIPFFPKELRTAQYAIRAFNVELASIRESVSNPTIGKMRMQFWKDAIDNIYKVCDRQSFYGMYRH